LGPLAVTAVAISGPFIISKHMGKAQMVWIERFQTRIDATAKMLHGMKGIKMLGLNSRMSSIIRQLRMDEITKSLKMRKLFVAMIAFGNMSDIFAPGAAFAIYVIVASVNGQMLDVTSAFTALSLIALLVAPIRSVVFATPPLIAALGCFDRIESFLSSPTRRDHRMLVSFAIQRQSSVIDSHKFDGNTNPLSDIELQEMNPRSDESSTVAIRVRNLTLAWSDQDTPVVDNVSLEFQHGHLTMIVGPVGSGKSSLLKGLLGEIPSSKGNVYVSRAHAAFVDQTSWIQNGRIREMLLGGQNLMPIGIQLFFTLARSTRTSMHFLTAIALRLGHQEGHSPEVKNCVWYVEALECSYIFVNICRR
jgi:ABC-type multidrug transport system fused ATPase/permease subunit